MKNKMIGRFISNIYNCKECDTFGHPNGIRYTCRDPRMGISGIYEKWIKMCTLCFNLHEKFKEETK